VVLFLGVFRNICWRHLVIKSILLFYPKAFNCENNRIIRMLIGMWDPHIRSQIHQLEMVHLPLQNHTPHCHCSHIPNKFTYSIMADPRGKTFSTQLFLQTNTNNFKRILTSTHFSKNNTTMEPPTCSCSTIHYTREFPRAAPNICSRTTF